jgi:NADPH2:quinone reductase
LESLALPPVGPQEVLIRVHYSGINYKDALAATGAAPILRKSPLTGGIDLSGVVEASPSAAFPPGTEVLVCGGGLSETRDGGYAEYALVPEALVLPLPPGIDLRTAMALGSAGFSAAQALVRLEDNGLTPAMGPVLVTGATGGVGSFAIDLLAGCGYQVVAYTGKAERAADYLRALGASEILNRHTHPLGTRPLERARFAAAIDSVGGECLPAILATLMPQGAVALVGLAGGAGFSATVYPFLLRGVDVLGIDSVGWPRSRKIAVWQRLATDLRSRHTARIVTQEVALPQLPTAFAPYLAGEVVGRTVVKVAEASSQSC